MGEQLPPGTKPDIVLKKISEADSFQLQPGFIFPNGKFALTYKFKEISTGKLTVSLVLTSNQISTNSATYQTICEYIVSSKKAYLDAISMVSDTPAIAQFRLTIRRSIVFADKLFQNILLVDIPSDPPFELRKGDNVLIEMKSNGAATIISDGFIQAREVA